MRFFILIALLFAFTAGGSADMAHALALGQACAHHQMDQDNSSGHEPCHSGEDQCDDCCCAHSHLMATSVTQAKTDLIYRQNFITPADHHHSTDLSDLKRPPRL